MVCAEHIERLGDLDERARPPVRTASAIIVDLTVILDRRAEIERRPRTTAGPPRPETGTAPSSKLGAIRILSLLRKGDSPENTRILHGAQYPRRRRRAS
jgi:hypothetical protein